MPDPKIFDSGSPGSLRTLLESSRHVTVIPRHERLACGTSRSVWTRDKPLLAIGLHHQDSQCALVLMDRPGGHENRRVGVFRISDIETAKPAKHLCPKPANTAEILEAQLLKTTSDAFHRTLDKRRPPKVIPMPVTAPAYAVA